MWQHYCPRTHRGLPGGSYREAAHPAARGGKASAAENLNLHRSYGGAAHMEVGGGKASAAKTLYPRPYTVIAPNIVHNHTWISG